MNPVRQAIYDLLANDSQLADLCNGIYWRVAPEGTDPPVCIFQRQAGVRSYTFGGEPMHDESYVVKGVGFADDAEAIDERVETILNNATITVDGRQLLLRPMAMDDITYGEDVEGEHYEHEGTAYRVVTERASS